MQQSREDIAEFFNIQNPARLVLLPSCTYALNLAILGLDWAPGETAIMSGLEHHAVSRTVRKLAREQGTKFEVMPYTLQQPIDLQFLEDKLKAGGVKLVVCTMASNVTGDICAVDEVCRLARQYGAMSLVDTAQTAGVLPVDVEDLGCDFMVFAGHKGLYGPPGVGGVFVREGIQLKTLAEGGTGKDSGKHAMSGSYPSTFEVGTHNLPAIAGLAAGVRWIKQIGVDTVRRHELGLMQQLTAGLSRIDGLHIYGNPNVERRTAVASITLPEIAPQEAACWLADKHNIVWTIFIAKSSLNTIRIPDIAVTLTRMIFTLRMIIPFAAITSRLPCRPMKMVL
jgi:selenocysteine lyase/cysteine desulfurase